MESVEPYLLSLTLLTMNEICDHISSWCETGREILFIKKRNVFKNYFEFQLALEKYLKSINRKNFKIKKTLHRSF